MRKVHVPPSPRIKMALARTGYNWLGAVLEIIDNSADAIKKRQELEPDFKGEINISCIGYDPRRSEERTIVVVDDGVGVDCSGDEDAIAKVWGMGGSGKDGADHVSYGVFGMGMKGAVEAIAEMATFTSRSSAKEEFQTSVYKSLEETFDIPVFPTSEIGEGEYENTFTKDIVDSGSLVTLRDIKAGPKKMDNVYDALEQALGRIYKSDLENSKYTVSLGRKRPRIIDEASGIDPLDGGEFTNWLIGGPNGECEEVEYDGHKFKIQLSHTPMGAGRPKNDPAFKNLGNGIKGIRKRGVYYTRNGREIAIATTEGKDLPWTGVPNVSNLFMKIDFEDNGLGNFPIQTDFGKKGIVQDEDFRRFLSKHIEHHIAKVKATTQNSKKSTETQEAVQNQVSSVFGALIKSSKQEAAPSTKKKVGRSTRNGMPSIKRQRYIGKTKKIDMVNGYGQRSSFTFEHIDDFKARDLPFWLEVGEEKGHWIVKLNEANTFVSEAVESNDLENLYKTTTIFCLAMKENFQSDEKIIECTEYFGQLWNEYSATSARLAKQTALGIVDA